MCVCRARGVQVCILTRNSVKYFLPGVFTTGSPNAYKQSQPNALVHSFLFFCSGRSRKCRSIMAERPKGYGMTAELNAKVSWLHRLQNV